MIPTITAITLDHLFIVDVVAIVAVVKRSLVVIAAVCVPKRAVIRATRTTTPLSQDPVLPCQPTVVLYHGREANRLPSRPNPGRTAAQNTISRRFPQSNVYDSHRRSNVEAAWNREARNRSSAWLDERPLNQRGTALTLFEEKRRKKTER